jgi:hypothetical protein
MNLDEKEKRGLGTWLKCTLSLNASTEKKKKKERKEERKDNIL